MSSAVGQGVARRGGGGFSVSGSGNTTHDAVVQHLQAALGQRSTEVEAALAQVAGLEAEVVRKEALLVSLSATHASEKAALRARVRDLEEALQGAGGGPRFGPLDTSAYSVDASSLSAFHDTTWRAPCPSCASAQQRLQGMRAQLEALVRAAAAALQVHEEEVGVGSGWVPPFPGSVSRAGGGGDGGNSSSSPGAGLLSGGGGSGGGSGDGSTSAPRASWLPAGTPADLAVQVEQEIDRGSAAMVSDVVHLLSEVDVERQRWDRAGRSNLSGRLVAVVNRFLAHITALREALSMATAQVSNLGYVAAAKDAVIEGLRHGLAHPRVDEYPAWPGAGPAGSTGAEDRGPARLLTDKGDVGSVGGRVDIGFAGPGGAPPRDDPYVVALAQLRLSSAIMHTELVRRRQSVALLLVQLRRALDT